MKITRERDNEGAPAERLRECVAAMLGRASFIGVLVLLTVVMAGCRRVANRISDGGPPPWRDEELMENLRPPRVLLESFWDASPQPEEDPQRMVGLVDASNELELESLISEVMRVHPTLEAAEATWQAAIQVRPQATAWYDPNFRFLNGPTLFGNNNGAHLWRLQFSQEVPWFGKTGLRGEIADHGAESARLDLVVARRRLQSLATDAFLEYALAERTYALAMEDHRLAREEQSTQRVKLTSGDEEPTDDELSLEELEVAALEVLELERSRDQLDRSRLMARRRVNGLLRRDPRKPLPPPRMPELPRQVPEESVSIVRALESRPEIAAARTREQTAQAQAALAYKDFYPNLIFVGRFDTNADQFWFPEQLNLRPQMGVYFYAPVQQGKRWARVRQTEALVRGEQVKRRIVEDQIRDEIRDLYADLEYVDRRRQTLNRLVAAAERRVNSRDDWVVLSGAEQTKELIASRRKLLKYQMEQLTADYQWQQQVVKLYGLIGDDLWLGVDESFGDVSPPSYDDSERSRNEIMHSGNHGHDAAREMIREASQWHDDESMDFPGPGSELPVFPE